MISVNNGLWSGSMSQVNLFLPKVLLVRVFYHNNTEESKKCSNMETEAYNPSVISDL